MRRLVLLLLCVWVCGAGPVSVVAQSPSKIEIEYHDGELSADLENAALEDVLQAITEKTGLDILVNDDVTTTDISATFKGLELDQGLKKILGRINYAVVYGPDRSIMKVAIFGKILQEFPDLPVEEPPGPEAGDGHAPEETADGRVITPPPAGETGDNPPPGNVPQGVVDADGRGSEATDSGG